jgi:hypothetical protein
MKKSKLKKIEDFFYKRILRPFIYLSRLGRKAMFGYADSGITFDHIYRNKAKGYTKFGKVVDRALLNLPASKATRSRKERIKTLLRDEIQRNQALGKKTRIVDLASGPARYLVELLSEDIAKDVESVCLDSDFHSIKYGKGIAGNRSILYKRSNVLRIGPKHRKFALKKNWCPNVVVSSGLVEYLDDETACSFFKRVRVLLDEGGLYILITQKSNPSKKLIEKLGVTKGGKKWELYYRDPKVVGEWLEKAGFKNINWDVDGWNMYVFFNGRK